MYGKLYRAHFITLAPETLEGGGLGEYSLTLAALGAGLGEAEQVGPRIPRGQRDTSRQKGSPSAQAGPTHTTQLLCAE